MPRVYFGFGIYGLKKIPQPRHQKAEDGKTGQFGMRVQV